MCDSCETDWVHPSVFIHFRRHWRDPINASRIADLCPKFPVWTALLSSFIAVCVCYFGSMSRTDWDVREHGASVSYNLIPHEPLLYSILNKMIWGCFFCLFQVTVIWRKSDSSPFLVCQTHAWQITRQRRGQKSLRYRMVVQLICSALFVISFCKMGIVPSAQQIVPASLMNRLLSFQLINIQHTRRAKGINNQQGICGYL